MWAWTCLYLSVCLSIRVCVCLSVHPSMCVSIQGFPPHPNNMPLWKLLMPWVTSVAGGGPVWCWSCQWKTSGRGRVERRTFPWAPQHEGADFLRAMTKVTGQNHAWGLSFHSHRLWPFHLVLPQSREEASEGSSPSWPPTGSTLGVERHWSFCFCLWCSCHYVAFRSLQWVHFVFHSKILFRIKRLSTNSI